MTESVVKHEKHALSLPHSQMALDEGVSVGGLPKDFKRLCFVLQLLQLAVSRHLCHRQSTDDIATFIY